MKHDDTCKPGLATGQHRGKSRSMMWLPKAAAGSAGRVLYRTVFGATVEEQLQQRQPNLAHMKQYPAVVRF